MKGEEIRKYTVEELGRKIADFRQELFNLRFQAVTGQLTNPIRIRKIRRDIARMQTVIHEKQKGIDRE